MLSSKDWMGMFLRCHQACSGLAEVPWIIKAVPESKAQKRHVVLPSSYSFPVCTVVKHHLAICPFACEGNHGAEAWVSTCVSPQWTDSYWLCRRGNGFIHKRYLTACALGRIELVTVEMWLATVTACFWSPMQSIAWAFPMMGTSRSDVLSHLC